MTFDHKPLVRAFLMVLWSPLFLLTAAVGAGMFLVAAFCFTAGLSVRLAVTPSSKWDHDYFAPMAQYRRDLRVYVETFLPWLA